MKNYKNVGTIGFLLLVSGVIGAAANQFITNRIPEKPLFAEEQLKEYKKAEAICGEGNVSELSYCENEDGCSSAEQLERQKFGCSDLNWASMSEASRSAREHENLQNRVMSYCEDIKTFGEEKAGDFYLMQ